MTKFGNTLRHARASRDLTLREAAKQIGISAAYLSEIETGKKSPDTDSTISLLARFYELDEKDLMFMARFSVIVKTGDEEIPDDMFRVARRIMNGDLSSEQVRRLKALLEEVE